MGKYFMGGNHNEIISKAMEILKKIGSGMYRDGTYTDDYLGVKYNFSGLSIEYYDNDNTRCLHIFINDSEVFYYDFINNEKRYIEGEWPSLIDNIYQQIPSIINKRINTLKTNKIKISELQGLADYFRFYASCAEKKNSSLNMINSELSKNDIVIKENVCYKTTNNLYDEHDHYISYIIYTVFYKGELVAEFNGSTLDVFPNIDYYASKFKPEPWTGILKSVIIKAKEYDHIQTVEKVNRDTREIIRKLKQKEGE